MSEVLKAIDQIAETQQAFQQNQERKLTEMNARVAELQGRIEMGEAIAERPSMDGGKFTRDEVEHKDAFMAWLRAPNDTRAKNHLADVQHEMVKGSKNITIGVDSAGGYGVPKVISDQVHMRIMELNPFRRLVKVVQVSTGDYRELISDGTNASSGWVSENGSRTATGTPQLIERKPTGGELYAYPQMSEWALQDIQFNAEQWLIAEVAQAFSNSLAAAIVNGSGNNQPTGLLNSTPVITQDDASPQRGAAVYKYVGLQNSGSPWALNYDSLVHVIHDIRPEYLAGDRVGWVMNRATLAMVRRIQDGSNRPIWQESMAAGVPPLLLGFPVWIADAMPLPAEDNFAIAFGDWSRGYLLAERNQMAITADPITSPGYWRFYCRQRIYGCPLDTHAIRWLRFSD